MEVAGDARALLGGREAALALGLALGPQRTFLQLGQACAALTKPVADDPGAAPDERAGEERHDRKLVLREARRGDVEGEQPGDDRGGQLQAGARRGRVETEEEEGDRRPERRAGADSRARSGRRSPRL